MGEYLAHAWGMISASGTATSQSACEAMLDVVVSWMLRCGLSDGAGFPYFARTDEAAQTAGDRLLKATCHAIALKCAYIYFTVLRILPSPWPPAERLLPRYDMSYYLTWEVMARGSTSITNLLMDNGYIRSRAATS